MPTSGPHTTVDGASEEPTAPTAATPESTLVLHAVEAILKQKGMKTGQFPIHISEEDMRKEMRAAAAALPLWAKIVFGIIGTIGVPAIGSFVTTAQAVWELPDRIEQIENTQKKQSKSLRTIEKALHIPSSRPSPEDEADE